MIELGPRAAARRSRSPIRTQTRFYPFEDAMAIYLGPRYLFGNIPLVNYLPLRLRKPAGPARAAPT